MFDCSLDYPDQLWWRNEEDYNRSVAILLYQADIEIRKREHSAEAYRNAMRIIQDWRDEKMSLRQRMRIYYLIARANDAIGLTSKGIESVDHALSLAFELKSDFDVSKLLFHRARMNRSELFLARAAEDARDCMMIIDEHAAQLIAESVSSVRLQLLPQLATYEFYLSDFKAAKKHVAAARKLIAQTPDATLPAAATAWVQVNMDILKRRPGLALAPSLQICEIYALKGNPLSYERAEILAAQTALAFAESLPVGTHRNLAIEMALPHLAGAEHLAETLHDRPGQALCQLERAHFDRLANRNSGRKSMILGVIQFADDIDDVAVLAQAHIMLADEFTALGELEMANGCYRATLDLLRDTEVPALGIPARRVLDEQDEFQL